MTRSRHLFHPRRRSLLEWLDADESVSDDRLTAHLETCARCASLLDELVLSEPSVGASAAEIEVGDSAATDLDRSLALAIRDVWTVPAELPVRIHRAIDQRVRAQRELELLLGLVSIGKDTAELLLPSDEDEKEEPR